MKLFLDTANRALIKTFLDTGLVDGITTNPTHLSKEGDDPKQVLRDICTMVKGPVSIEVVEKEPEAVYAQAVKIAAFAPNVVVKIPFSQAYLPVIHKLVTQGVKLNITLVFTPIQALMVAKLGVTYISPFLGRLDEIGVNGSAVLREMVAIKKEYLFTSQILAASIRHVLHWQEAAVVGADVATVPPALFEQAMRHPLTDRGIAQFDADWQKVSHKQFV